jgi:hypothetical protein
VNFVAIESCETRSSSTIMHSPLCAWITLRQRRRIRLTAGCQHEEESFPGELLHDCAPDAPAHSDPEITVVPWPAVRQQGIAATRLPLGSGAITTATCLPSVRLFDFASLKNRVRYSFGATVS